MAGGEEIPPRTDAHNDWIEGRRDTGDNRIEYVKLLRKTKTWILRAFYLPFTVKTGIEWKEEIVRSELTRRQNLLATRADDFEITEEGIKVE